MVETFLWNFTDLRLNGMMCKYLELLSLVFFESNQSSVEECFVLERDCMEGGKWYERLRVEV